MDYMRNLEAVRTGAMVKDAGADTILLKERLIRVNSKRWYDLTPKGREYLRTLKEHIKGVYYDTTSKRQ